MGGKISPIHKQINFHALFRDCSASDGYISSRKEKNTECSLSFKTAALPQGKDPGRQLRGEPVNKSNSTRGVQGFFFYYF